MFMCSSYSATIVPKAMLHNFKLEFIDRAIPRGGNMYPRTVGATSRPEAIRTCVRTMMLRAVFTDSPR